MTDTTTTRATVSTFRTMYSFNRVFSREGFAVRVVTTTSNKNSVLCGKKQNPVLFPFDGCDVLVKISRQDAAKVIRALRNS